MATFVGAKLTSVTANLKQNLISITVKIPLNDENMDKVERLKPYLEAETGGVTLEINPIQIPLKLNQQAEQS